MSLKLRRGTDSERLTITPEQGEVIYVTDTKRVFVGDGTTVGGIAVGLTNANAVFNSVVVNGNTTTQHLIPSANVTYDIGTIDSRYRDLYLSGNTIYLGGTVISSSANTLQLPANTIVGNTVISNDYNDLTNKPDQDLNTTDDVTFANASFTSVEHEGLVLTEGTNVDQVYVTNQILQITEEWIDTSVNSTTLPTGTYIVQIKANDTSVGGQHVNEYYSGLMSWYSNNTDSTVFDEIALHRAGEGPGSGAIYLRVQRTEDPDSDELKLQIAGSGNTLDSAILYVFKFRRLL